MGVVLLESRLIVASRESNLRRLLVSRSAKPVKIIHAASAASSQHEQVLTKHAGLFGGGGEVGFPGEWAGANHALLLGMC